MGISAQLTSVEAKLDAIKTTLDAAVAGSASGTATPGAAVDLAPVLTAVADLKSDTTAIKEAL